MKFKRKTNVLINLKDMTYLRIFCTYIFIEKSSMQFIPDYYVFMIYDETVAKIPCGMVKDFSYFKSSFDTELTTFEFISKVMQ